MHLAQERRGRRRDHEPDHRLCSVLLLGNRQQTNAAWTRYVHGSGHGPDKIGPCRAHHDVTLLNAELEISAGQEEGDRAGAATGENDLWLQLLGQAELRDALRDMLAAAAARIADRFRR